MLSVVLAAGMVYAIASFQTVANLTVNEPLTVTPASVPLTIFAGDCATYNVIISNAASFQIGVTFSTAVTTVPTGGSAADVTRSATFDGTTLTPSTIFLVPLATASGPGLATINVAACVDSAATPGDYVITNTVTKD